MHELTHFVDIVGKLRSCNKNIFKRTNNWTI